MLIFTFRDVTTTTARYTKARKMEQTGTHTNNKAEEEDDNRDTDIRVGDNATETTAKITIHGRRRTVSFQQERAYGRSLRKSKDWNQDHGDAGEKETNQFSLWLKRLSSELRRGDENAIWAKTAEEEEQKSSQETEKTTRDEEMSDIETEIIEQVSYASGNPTPPANDVEGLKKQLKAARKFIEYQKRDHRDRDNHARAQLTKMQEAFLTETTIRIGMQMGLNRLKEMIKNMEEVLDTEIVAMTYRDLGLRKEGANVMNQIEGALTGNYLVRMKVSRLTQLSHEVCISHVTNSC